MFYNIQTQKQRNKYKDYLQIIGSLSNLFSSSDVPYLYYRIAENPKLKKKGTYGGILI